MMADVKAGLAALEGLDRDALAERWVAAFGCPAPHRSRSDFLRRAVAWKIQVEAAGGFDPALARRLAALSGGKPDPAPRLPVLRPGARLMREWQGVAHTVIVTKAGFEHQGKPYASLSAVARAITGTSWSGPRFFGLRDKP